MFGKYTIVKKDELAMSKKLIDDLREIYCEE